jgi:hypothetical protein
VIPEGTPQEVDHGVVDGSCHLRAHLRLVQQGGELIHSLPLEVVEQPGDRLLGDHEPGHDPLVQHQLAHEALEQLEQLVQRTLDAAARLLVGENRGEAVDGHREIARHLPLDGRHQVGRQAVE